MAAFTAAYNPAGAMAISVERIIPLATIYTKIGSHGFDWPIPPETV